MSEFQSDLHLVKNYVTAIDHLQYSLLPEDVVAVLITHSNLAAKHLDIKFNLHSTIGDVKEKIRTHIGTPPCHQRLILKCNGDMRCEMNDDNRMLGYYSVESGMEIHVIDTDPFSLSRGGGLTDTSLIQKYKMTEESYDKRKGTLRDYIREQKAKDPNFKIKPKSNGTANFTPMGKSAGSEDLGPPPGPESVEGISLGDRCEIKPGARRGVVKFIGELPSLRPGHWVGVHLDEPMGKHDGTLKGERIFECPPGHGTFVRGNKVAVGDYPERDILADEEEDEEHNATVEEPDEI